MAGKYLVGPTGERITLERLEGIIWRQKSEARRDAARARRSVKSGQHGIVTVLRIRQNDWHREHFGTIAG